MADARLKALFKRAAEIAEEMPEELQEAAFHRALDVLVGTPTTQEAQAYAEYLENAAEEASLIGLPKAAARLVLDKSFDVLNLATGVLGMDALTAGQVAKVLNESYGMVVSNDTVARTLESADGLISGVRRGGNTLYKIVQPGKVPARGKRSTAKKKAGAKPKPPAARKTAAKKKPAPQRAQKKK